MKAVLVGGLIALAAGPAQAFDWGQMYGYVQWTSDYRYLGYSESNRHPTEQGGLHWTGPDGVYAGLFVTGVDFKDYRNTSYETDLYAGKQVLFGANDLNLEVLADDFPDTAGHPTYLPTGVILPTYNFFEASADLTHTIGRWKLGLKLLAEPRPDSHGGDLTVLDGHASYALTDWLEASGHGGHQWSGHGADMNHWDLGLTATWRLQWVFDLRYYATDIARRDCYGMTWCQPALVAKITYNFLVPWP